MNKLLLLGFFASSVLLSQAQTNFATIIPDGAWTWYNDPRALFYEERVYVGYVRAGDGQTALSAFDPRMGTSTDLWSSGFTTPGGASNARQMR